MHHRLQPGLVGLQPNVHPRGRLSVKIVSLGLVVCLAAMLPYLSSLNAYFIGDDFGYVQLLADRPAWHVLGLFGGSWSENIWGMELDELRPILALTYQLNALGGASSPTPYHISNIAFHALNGLLVLSIARLMGGIGWLAATLAAVVFAVLPMHAETVAWITGRPDSLLTLFYLAAFLLYGLWRQRGEPWYYWLSVLVFLVALFSKEPALTLPVLVVAYDILVTGRRPWTRIALRDYLVFAILIVAYLMWRSVLFTDVVRESRLSSETLAQFVGLQARYLQTIFLGLVLPVESNVGLAWAPLFAWLGLLVGILLLKLGGSAERGDELRLLSRRLLFFGPVWWGVTIAPMIVVGPGTPRQLYLTSVGVAVSLGLLLDAVWRSRGRLGRAVAVVGGVGMVVAYSLALQPAVAAWNTAAEVSAKISQDTQRELDAAPPGSLIVLGAPYKGTHAATFTWLWSWALPFALQPPFMAADMASRTLIISPRIVSCCETQWLDDTRRSLNAWAGSSAPVVVLLWDASSGTLLRWTEADDGSLRERLANLAQVEASNELDGQLDALLAELGRPQGIRLPR